MFFRTALRLANENRALRVENARLLLSLRLAREGVRKRTDERDAARRDAVLLVSMAKDREVAAGFVETWHDIDSLGEVEP